MTKTVPIDSALTAAPGMMCNSKDGESRISKVNPHKQAAVPIIDRPPEFEPDAQGYGITRSNGSEPKHIIWLRRLWAERRFLGRITIYGLIFTALVSLVLPPRYQSATRLMPPDESGSGIAMAAMMAAKNSLGSMGGMGANLAGAASDLLGLKNSTALFSDMLGSRTVQDRMIERFDLRKVYGDRYWVDARKDLAKHTDVTEDRKSNVMTITVTDRDPHRAEQMAQAYVEELDRVVAQVSTSAARRERIFIEQRLQTVRQDLDKTSKEFSEYESKNTVLDMPYQAKAMVEAAAQLQGQLIAAQSELDGLEQIYTSSNVRVRSLRARVNELKSQLARMSGAAEGGDRSTGSDESASDLYPSIRQLPLLGVHWLDLYREAKIQETVYELLTQQYELAKIQEAKEIPTVKVLDPADVPEKRSFPKRTLIVFLGTFLAFSLGVVVVLGAARWREIEPHVPEKQFATEIWVHLKAQMQLAREDGYNPRAIVRRFWRGTDDGMSRGESGE